MYKPRPEVYQLAVASLAIPKESIGFVSSNYWDIAGATSFGFRAYWLNRNSSAADELGVKPTATLPDLSTLPALLAHS
jgi:2-haloacid dehalogenase